MPLFRQGSLPCAAAKAAIVLAACMAWFALAPWGTARAEPIPDVLVAAIPNRFLPQYDIAETGKPYGFAIEVMDHLARIADLRIEYRVLENWNAVHQALRSGEAHLVPNMGFTDGRREFAEFSLPLETFPLSIFVRKDYNGIRDEQDLGGHSVAVVRPNAGYALLKDRDDVDMVVAPNRQDALFRLLAGHVDALVYPEPPIRMDTRAARIESHIRTVGAPLMEIKRGVGVAKGHPELLARINGAIGQFVGTETFRRIYTSWYGKPEPFFTTRRVTIGAALLLGIGLVGFLVYRNRLLHVLSRNMEMVVRDKTRALEQSRNKLQKILEATTEGIWILDMDTGHLEFGSRYYTLLGYDADAFEPTAEHLTKLIHPTEAEQVVRGFQQYLVSAEEEHHTEMRLLTADGDYRWFLSRACKVAPTADSAENLIVGSLRDITDLKESELRFKALHNASFGGIAIHDKGRILDCNQGLADISGYTMDELVGMDGLLLIAEQSRPLVMNNILSGTEKPYEARGVRKDGTEYPLQLEGRNIPYQDIQARVVEFRDLTERKRAEREVQLLFQLLENADSIAVVKDKDLRYLSVNKAFLRLTGYESQEPLLGRTDEEIFAGLASPEQAREYTDNDRKALSLPRGEILTVEESFPGEDDTPRVFLTKKFPVYEGADGPLLGVATLTNEITERKDMERALRKAKEQAEAANRTKSDFLANMSHEIRTPLNGIMGMLQLIQHADVSEEVAESAHIALSSSERLTRLLSDILDLSRMEAGKLPIQHDPFRPDDALCHLSALFKVTAMQAGVLFQCHADPGLPEWVQGDVNRLQQVLNNLVGNALKFTDSGTVEVAAWPMPLPAAGKARVLFMVRDTGIGMPEDRLATLFEPFSQHSSGMRRKYQGAGLGLTICKQLVDLMGGCLSVSSEPGNGTAVYFSIPFDLAEKPDQVGPGRMRLEGGSLQGLSILLAEDDPVNSLAARRQLEKEGCSVCAVQDGPQVLETLSRDRFDLVLMDVQMPGMDGLETTRAIREGATGETNRELPVIALTAYAMSGDKERFLASGMNGYVSKPMQMADLKEAILQAIG